MFDPRHGQSFAIQLDIKRLVDELNGNCFSKKKQNKTIKRRFAYEKNNSKKFEILRRTFIFFGVIKTQLYQIISINNT